VVVPALAAGVGLALSLPPWGFWILAGPAAGLLWWRLGGLRFRQRLLAGWVAGLGLFVIGLFWVTSFNVYGGIVLMLVEALVLGLACAASPPGRGRLAALAGAMVLLEALRSTWPFGGLPLGGVALGQAGGPLAGAARVGGPLLLVGMVWLGGAGLGGLATVIGQWLRHHGVLSRAPRGWDLLARRAQEVGGVPGSTRVGPSRHHDAGVPRTPGPPSAAPTAARPGGTKPGARSLVTGATALAAVTALAVWGTVAPDGGPTVGTLRVAAVQGGGARGVHKAQVSPASVLAAQLAATAEVPAADDGRPPRLVVWPEDVVALQEPLARSPDQTTLAELARHLGATLTVGVTETVSDTAFRNEIVAFAPSGALVARFEKVHRVPFGEYIPDRAFFSHLANLSAVPLDAIPGHGDGVLRTPATALGTMVSYEVFFAARGRIATRAGARLLIVPTNTASYSTSQVPTQEMAAARLQAIAEGRDLVQASPTGFSALIDNRGRVLARSVLGRRQVLVGDVQLRRGATIYERFGDLPVLIGAAVLLVGGWLAALTDVETSDEARRAGAKGRSTPARPLMSLRLR
jgi:apolipoprotein N-acyltransferase